MSSDPVRSDKEYAALRALVEAKVLAELEAADSLCFGTDEGAVAGPDRADAWWRGDLLAEVMVVKGQPGPAEKTGRPAVSGPDGEALGKALEALGFDSSSVFFAMTDAGVCTSSDSRTRRLRLQIEAVDAELVIALDKEAASDLARAFGLDALAYGEVVSAFGRRLLAVDGLEASLSDESSKTRIWSQLSAARPLGPVY